MTTSTRERRDWTLLIFLIPIGIIFMLIAGHFAVRLLPIWSVNAGMQSKLDLNHLSRQQNAPLQPISPAILTPLGWLDTFLTPGAGSGDQSIVFPPFIVLEPTATEVTSPPQTVAPTQPPPTIPVTASPTMVVPQPTTSSTPKPPVDPPTVTTPLPTVTTPLPTVTTPPPTVTTPPPTVTTPSPTATTPSPTVTTLPPGASTPIGTQVTTVPSGFNIGTPDGSISLSNLSDGQFYVVDLGSDSNNQVKVNGIPDGPDLVYYEMLNGGKVFMDQVIIGISQYSDGNFMYTVFNWGDGVRDMNSNIGVDSPAPYTENDDQEVTTTLYGTPPLQTGIAIDVDNAPSAPPIGWYQYIVIQAPYTSTSNNNGIDVDAIQVLPDPPLPVVLMSIPPADETPILPADEVPIPPADEVPVLPEAPP